MQAVEAEVVTFLHLEGRLGQVVGGQARVLIKQ